MTATREPCALLFARRSSQGKILMNLPKLLADRGPLCGRRQMLRAGALGAFGLNVARLWEARAAAREMSSAARETSSSGSLPPLRNCVVIYFYGGPSQLETWDPKPAAPAEVRGEFRPIATSVAGLQIGEHLPRCAQIQHKLALVRTLHHPMRNHNSAAVESLCGRTPTGGDAELLGETRNNFPCYGSVVSRQLPRPDGLPAHVALPHVMYNVVQLPGQSAGFLGADHHPFQITRDPNDPQFRVDELQLPADLPLSRLDSRQSLLRLLDQQRARAEQSDSEQAMDVYQQRAFDLLHSSRVRAAFDLARETPALRDRYGRHRLGQSLLLARRLVESGVRFVNVNDKVRNGQLANWDSHLDNFSRLKNDLLPPADQALSAFVEDLDARGLLESTLVIALAEFGRTPLINRNAGRDHWPDCFSIVLAGGGLRGGTVLGTSDRLAAYPVDDPVSPGDLAATIYWRFGIDPATEVRDLADRPYRLAEGQPLRQLFS